MSLRCLIVDDNPDFGHAVRSLLEGQGIAVVGLKGGVEGMIRIHGESWRATSTQDVAAGSAVKVLRIEGLKLHVAPAGPEGRAGSS